MLTTYVALKIKWPSGAPMAAPDSPLGPLVVGEGKHEKVYYSSNLVMYLDESATPGAVSVTLTEGQCALSWSISGRMEDLKAGPMMNAFDCAMNQADIKIFEQASQYGAEIEAELEDSLRAQIAAATACCGHAADALTGTDETEEYGEDSMAEEKTTLVAGAGGGVQYCLRSHNRVIQARTAHSDGLLAHFDPDNLLSQGGNMLNSQCDAERLVLGKACGRSIELIDQTRENLRDLIDGPLSEWHSAISGPLFTEYLPGVYAQFEDLFAMMELFDRLDIVLTACSFLPAPLGPVFNAAKKTLTAFKTKLETVIKAFKTFKMAVSLIANNALLETDNVDKLAKVTFYGKRFLRELQAILHIVNYVYHTNSGEQGKYCGKAAWARYDKMKEATQFVLDKSRKAIEMVKALLDELAAIRDFFVCPKWVNFWDFLGWLNMMLNPFFNILDYKVCVSIPWATMEDKCIDYWWFECDWDGCSWVKQTTCMFVPYVSMKQFCFTLRDIIKGVTGALKLVSDALNEVVEAILKALSALGMPSIPWPDLGLDWLLKLLRIDINWPTFRLPDWPDITWPFDLPQIELPDLGLFFYLPTFDHPLLGLLDCTMQKVPPDDETDLERFGQLLLTGGGGLAGGGAMERAANSQTNANRWRTSKSRVAAAKDGKAVTEDGEDLMEDADEADPTCFNFQACKEAFVEIAAFYGSKEDANSVSRNLDFAQCVAVDIAGYQACEEQKQVNLVESAEN